MSAQKSSSDYLHLHGNTPSAASLDRVARSLCVSISSRMAAAEMGIKIWLSSLRHQKSFAFAQTTGSQIDSGDRGFDNDRTGSELPTEEDDDVSHDVVTATAPGYDLLCTTTSQSTTKATRRCLR